MSQRLMDVTFLDIIVDVPAVGDRRFTYSCPADMILPRGAKVRVPFGRAKAEGFVLSRAAEPPPVPVKPIEDVYDLDFLPPSNLLELACDLAGYYCASISSLWSCLWPPVAPRKSLARLIKEGGTAYRQGEATVCETDPISRDAEFSERLGRVPVQLLWGGPEFRWSRYLELIKETLACGKGVLFLTPEIRGLGSALERLSSQFPDETCAVHSEMTGLMRRGAWLSLVKGDRRLAAGTRSAAFAPVKDLGLVVLDDEASSAYKSVDWPFYDARTVAMARALSGARIIFGSAHPSVETVWNCQAGPWTCLRESGPVEPGHAREAVVVDLRDSRPGREIISEPLREELERAFSKGDRALLFLNRRGDSSQISCLDCGSAILCSRCGVPLSYHSKEKEMVCHTCGLRTEAPLVCPVCGGHKWRMSGYGVEKAESEFKKKFPVVPVFRLDKDAAKGSSADDTLRGFGAVCPSCLVATQIVLGRRLPPLTTVVGVLSADTALSLPDFRASEKAYQLLSRLGDAVVPGAGSEGVYVIQTRNPDHHAVRGVVDSDLFYETELQNRRMLGYPPFKRFFKIRFGGRTSEKVREAAEEFAGRVPPEGKVRVLGPIPAPKPKVRGQYWWQVALRGDDHEEMAAACRAILSQACCSRSVKVLIDVDPIDME